VFRDQPPTIIDGRTLVPVRGVFEAMGYTVNWDEMFREITIRGGGHTLRLNIGGTRLNHQGPNRSNNSGELEVSAQIINGATMVPIRPLAEAVGATVEWNPATQTIAITTNSVDNTLVRRPEQDIHVLERAPRWPNHSWNRPSRPDSMGLSVAVGAPVVDAAVLYPCRYVRFIYGITNDVDIERSIDYERGVRERLGRSNEDVQYLNVEIFGSHGVPLAVFDHDRATFYTGTSIGVGQPESLGGMVLREVRLLPREGTEIQGNVAIQGRHNDGQVWQTIFEGPPMTIWQGRPQRDTTGFYIIDWALLANRETNLGYSQFQVVFEQTTDIAIVEFFTLDVMYTILSGTRVPTPPSATRSDLVRETWNALNEKRAHYWLQPLHFSEEMADYAQAHAEWSEANGNRMRTVEQGFRHGSIPGATSQTGAHGHGAAAMRSLQGSHTHRQRPINYAATHVGIGVVRGWGSYLGYVRQQ
jgi:uncharacterized protein YkwD